MKHHLYCEKIGLDEKTPWHRIDWDEVKISQAELDDVDFGMKLVRGLLPKGGLKETIQNARRFIALAIAGSGAHCPVCGKWAKINAHNFSGSHARSLLYLTNCATVDRKWINCLDKRHPDWLRGTNQHQLMERWGLVQRHTSKQGHWRHTILGARFAMLQEEIPAKVFTYSGRTVGFSIDEVKCSEIKGEVFNHKEHMQDTWMGELMKRRRKRKKRKNRR